MENIFSSSLIQYYLRLLPFGIRTDCNYDQANTFTLKKKKHENKTSDTKGRNKKIAVNYSLPKIGKKSVKPHFFVFFDKILYFKVLVEHQEHQRETYQFAAQVEGYLLNAK